MVDFIQGGSDTTTNTLAFALLFLSKFPKIQEKVWGEMDGVVGRERTPNLADRDKLPYFNAFVTETLRHARLLTLMPRRAMEDFWYRGYFFKKVPKIFSHRFSTQENKLLLYRLESALIQKLT